MTTCLPTVTDLNRADRVHISWDTTGVPSDAQAWVRLDHGPRIALSVGTDVVVGYFAGPAYPSPAPATVIPHTSYAQIIIVTTTETLTFPGGFIRLTP